MITVTSLLCSDCGRAYKIEEYQPPRIDKRLLASNEAPPDELVPSLGVASAELQQDIRKLQEQIGHVEALLDGLRAKERQMKEILVDCDSLLSPIRRVPIELVVEIVLSALQLEFVPVHPPAITLDTKKGLWTFSQVCRAWRHALLARPSLWSRVEVTDGYFLSTAPQVFRTILSRSANQNLFLTLDFSLLDSTTHELAELAVAESDRWQCLQLGGFNTGWNMPQYLESTTGRLSRLQSLDITDCVLPARAFGTAPLLQKASFSIVDLNGVNLPWSQITHLALYCCGGGDDILARLPNLIELHVSDHEVQLEHDLSKVKSLSLDFQGTKLVARTPNLSRLYLRDNSVFSQDLVALHQCTLNTLRLGHTFHSFPESLLSSLSSITTLILPDINIGGDIENLLVNDSTAFPNLSKLYIPFDSMDEYTMLAESSRRLQMVCFYRSPLEPDDNEARWTQIRRNIAKFKALTEVRFMGHIHWLEDL